MKRKLCIAITVFLLATSNGGFVFAADAAAPATTENATTSAIVPNMNFVGPEIKLSLKQATDVMMTSSSGIAEAKIKLAQDQAATEVSASEVSKLRKAEKLADDPNFWGSSPSKTAKEMARITVEHLKGQAQNNYDAAVNGLKAQLISTYYETLQAQDAVRISEENVKIQETILKNVKLKYSLGTASKQDTLQAEVALNQKKVLLEGTQNALIIKQMNFNQYFGYPLMQKVTLTDSLAPTDFSKITLQDAITRALKNRNEIATTKYNLDYSELALKETGNNYSSGSYYYMNAQVKLLAAQKANRDISATIEKDIRSKYLQMKASKTAVDSAKSSLDMSKESFRLMQLSYDAGLKTLTDVQQAQVLAYDAAVQYSKSILSYNLAVLAYEQSTTVGTTAFFAGSDGSGANSNSNAGAE